jgi:phosphatidylinositol kinase/protein kinase (PI-3  family)
MFNPNNVNCLLSRRLTDSRAKDDIVVNEPQKPIAKSSEYFVSRFQNIDKIENTPSMKLPMTFMIRMLTGSVPRTIVDDTSLYLRNAPARAPTPNKTNSSPFIFSIHLPNSILLIGIISILVEAVLVNPRLMP